MTFVHFLTEYGWYLGYLWLIIGLFFLLLEVGTPGLFFFVSFACGSFIAATLAFGGYSVITQCWAAVGGALLTFAIIKSMFANKSSSPMKTNVHALIGQTALVTEPITPHQFGRVKIKGEEWPAVATPHQTITQGTTVVIVRVEGNKVIVTTRK